MPSDTDAALDVHDVVELYERLISDSVTAAVLVDAALAHDEAQQRHRGWRWLFDSPMGGHAGCICCPHNNPFENDALLDGLDRIGQWAEYSQYSTRLQRTRLIIRSIVASGYRVVFADGRPILASVADGIAGAGESAAAAAAAHRAPTAHSRRSSQPLTPRAIAQTIENDHCRARSRVIPICQFRSVCVGTTSTSSRPIGRRRSAFRRRKVVSDSLCRELESEEGVHTLEVAAVGGRP